MGIGGIGVRRSGLVVWARLKFHAGWSGWTRPPTMGGGGGWVAGLRRVKRGFLKGSERPEAGCLGELNLGCPLNPKP